MERGIARSGRKECVPKTLIDPQLATLGNLLKTRKVMEIVALSRS